ncbi:MAG: hypothetical protein ACFFA1_07440 [Promethearchaeota archaeon]
MSSARNALGFFFCLVAAWAITYFVGLGGTIADLETIIGAGANAILTLVSGICIAQLSAFPLLLGGTYATIIALAVGGLIGGLVSRKYSGALVITIGYMIFLFIFPWILNFVSTLDPVLAFNAILLLLGPTGTDQAIAIVVAFLAVLVPSMIGAAITAEEEEY